MKKLLLLFALMLTGVGAWAQETFGLPTVSDENNTVWYNIYFSSYGGSTYYPVYLSAHSEGTEKVNLSKDDFHYGYSALNTKEKSDSISWAIYQNGDYYYLKNKLTNKFIHATGTEDGALNVEFVETIEEATGFEFLSSADKTWNGTPKGEFAIKSANNPTSGYISAWSASNSEATNADNQGHQGAWVTFRPAPDFDELIEEVDNTLEKFGDGVGMYTPADEAQLTAAMTAMENSNTVKLNDLNSYKDLLSSAELNLPDPNKYYYVANGCTQAARNGAKLFVTNTGSMKVAKDEVSLLHVFKFETAGENTFYLYNVGRGAYVTDVTAKATTTADAKAMTIASMNRGDNAVSIKPEGSNMFHANGSLDVIGYNSTDITGGSNWIITEVDNLDDVSHELTIGTTGWATLYLPFNATIPADAQLYMVTSKTDNNATLTELTGDILPGDVPVLVKATASTTLDFKFTTNTPEDDETLGIDLNMLMGSVFDEDVAEEGYVLANVDGVTGFYKALMAEGSFMNNAFKAYLPAEGAAGARLLFDFGTETAIESIEGAENADAEVYDLAGRRVKGVQKGLYIVNGKVVIK